MKVRPAAVAGMFYPDDPRGLRAMVERFLDDARGGTSGDGSCGDSFRGDSGVGSRGNGSGGLAAVIVPHAGYVYSGSTAGLAYVLLEPLADKVKHVVVVGPTHRVGVRGVALPDASGMATPLGVVPLWNAGVELALAQPYVLVSEAVHAQEHSLEVQLPFLQVVLPDVDVLPLAAGWVEPQVVADVLSAVWADDVLVVISSDLSHYHRYDQAQAIDRATMDQILALDPSVDHDQACGATGVDAIILAARQRRLTPRLLGMCNSGDTAGDKSQVVGYAAVAIERQALQCVLFRQDAEKLGIETFQLGGGTGVSDERGDVLLGIARWSIMDALGITDRCTGTDPDGQSWLAEPGASFVTLRIDGELRGCIGSLTAYRPLGEDVRGNARSAAFEDPRFPPLTLAEFEQVRIEVSVLSAPQPMPFTSKQDALALLRPGVDGVVLSARGRRATFLPQVWEELPEPEQFIRHLMYKAGLPPDFWDDSVRIERYTVAAYEEPADVFR